MKTAVTQTSIDAYYSINLTEQQLKAEQAIVNGDAAARKVFNDTVESTGVDYK